MSNEKENQMNPKNSRIILSEKNRLKLTIYCKIKGWAHLNIYLDKQEDQNIVFDKYVNESPDTYKLDITEKIFAAGLRKLNMTVKLRDPTLDLQINLIYSINGRDYVIGIIGFFHLEFEHNKPLTKHPSIFINDIVRKQD